jgi:acyl-CoA synthetase (NDP forming)
MMDSSDVPVILEDWIQSLSLESRPNEWEAKKLLNAVGIPAQTGLLLLPDEQLYDACSSQDCTFTYPVVVKVCSGEILHKTDVGGIALNVAEEELAERIEALQSQFPDAPLTVADMVRYEGSEIILGALHDDTFGPAVMVGAGGILTELYSDVSFRLAPCTKKEAARMLRELVIFPVLNGYRGMAASWEQLAEIIEKVSHLAEALIQKGGQLDINPIVWTGETWLALDAMIILSNS